jgi:molybdenum cofactor synthesis domain-containing protein
MMKVAIITCSDRCSQGKAEDKSGPLMADLILELKAETVKYIVIPDEQKIIEEHLQKFCDELKVDLILTSGGTGLGSRDVTPEATQNVAHKIIPGISELMRAEGLKQTKFAVLSRGICALRNKTLIINLPGSPKGVQESLQPIFEIIKHALAMIKDKDHK